MLNWDSYGNMAHNYYLYNHPEAGFTWTPWDNNESMSSRSTNNKLTIIPIGNIQRMALIRYIMDDPVYSKRYRTYSAAFTSALSDLKQHVVDRLEEVEEYLGE